MDCTEQVRKELKRIRKLMRLTQDEVAALAGISGTRISNLEKKSDGLTIYTLEVIANALGYDLDISVTKNPNRHLLTSPQRDKNKEV